MGAIAPVVSLIGGAGGGLAGLGTFGTILEIGLGVLGAVQSSQAGDAEADAIRAQAEVNRQQSLLEREGERVQATIDATERTRRLRVVLAEQSAAFSASGFRPSSGTFAAIATESERLGELEIERGDTLSEVNQRLLTAQAAGFRASGEAGAAAAKSSASTSAFGSLLGTGTSLLNRGSVPGSLPAFASPGFSPPRKPAG